MPFDSGVKFPILSGIKHPSKGILYMKNNGAAVTCLRFTLLLNTGNKKNVHNKWLVFYKTISVKEQVIYII